MNSKVVLYTHMETKARVFDFEYVCYYRQDLIGGERVFVITGGGSGIGKALAHALAMRGRRVLIVGRSESSLIETARFSTLIDYLLADVSTTSGRQTILLHVNSVSSLDGLVHNAGIIDPIAPIAAIAEGDFRQAIATNVEAPLFLSQLLHEKLTAGRILHIGSGAAYFPVAGWAAYCVSKAALSMLTRCWQLECKDMAVANVMPGIIDTHMQAVIREATHMEKEKIDFFIQLKRNNQLLSPETVALFLSWLLLDIDKARYVSEEWDIYDQTHHEAWLVPPHIVPVLE